MIVVVAFFTDNSGRQLEPGALVAAVRALEALAHERTVAKLKLESDEVAAAAAAQEGNSRYLMILPLSFCWRPWSALRARRHSISKKSGMCSSLE